MRRYAATFNLQVHHALAKARGHIKAKVKHVKHEVRSRIKNIANEFELGIVLFSGLV